MHIVAFDANRKNRALRGFTLTEIAIVLGIIGTVLGAIWVAAAHAYNNQKITRAVTQILAIAGSVQALYPSGQIPGGPNVVILPMLINSNAVPADMIASCTGSEFGSFWGGTAGCAFTPWNNQVAVGSQEGWGGVPSATNRFEIDIGSMTNAQCAGLLGSLLQGASSGSLVEIETPGTGIVTVTSATSPTTFANCVPGATTAVSDIILQFKL